MEVSALSWWDQDSAASCRGSPAFWQSACHESAGVSGDMWEGTSAGHTGSLMNVSGKGTTAQSVFLADVADPLLEGKGRHRLWRGCTGPTDWMSAGCKGCGPPFSLPPSPWAAVFQLIYKGHFGWCGNTQLSVSDELGILILYVCVSKGGQETRREHLNIKPWSCMNP